MAAAVVSPAKKRRAPLPGESLGFPMFHALTGNLPVLSAKFHTPTDGVVVKPSDYDYMTGNLPVLSKELAAGTDDDLMPGWVQLRDPVLQRMYWWNLFHRSRREARPSPLDDGSRGAGRGEAEGRSLAAAYLAHVEAGASSTSSAANWEEHFSAPHQRLFYCNRKLGLVSWARPADFGEGGVPYLRQWALRSDPPPSDSAAAGAATPTVYYWNASTNTHTDVPPPGYDGPLPIDSWQAATDPATGVTYYCNALLGATQWEAPPGWPRPVPAELPPMPPRGAGLDSAVAALARMLLGGDLPGSGGAGGDDGADDEDPTLVYPSFQGYLRKKGGGVSLLGRRTWKDRFFVLQGGLLSYYADQGAWEAGAEPLKSSVPLRFYAVDAMLADPKRFALVPLASAPPDAAGDDDDDEDGGGGGAKDGEGAGGAPASGAAAGAGKSTRNLDSAKSSRNVGAAATGSGGGGGGRSGSSADRAFQLEAPSALLKARWVVRLRGRRADGRHRADSAEIQAFVSATK